MGSKIKWNMRIIVATGMGALALYIFAYAIMTKEMARKYGECKKAEGGASYARSIIESAGKDGAAKPLLAEGNIPKAIDELTKNGKAKGINFISITPRDIRKGANTQCAILPIGMNIESTYEQLGEFLGSLDKMDDALIKVESFDVFSDRKDINNITTSLVLDLYCCSESGTRTY